jgi:hypothetical protein
MGGGEGDPASGTRSQAWRSSRPQTMAGQARDLYMTTGWESPRIIRLVPALFQLALMAQSLTRTTLTSRLSPPTDLVVGCSGAPTSRRSTELWAHRKISMSSTHAINTATTKHTTTPGTSQ